MPESGTYGSVRGAAGNSRPYRECRRMTSPSRRTRVGVRKPPKKEPAGSWWAVGRLWGFGSAAGLPGDGLLENC
jgi:hypothetical protein